MKTDIGQESRFLSTPPAFDAPVRGGGSRRNIAITFGVKKLEWRKNFVDTFIRFDRVHEHDGQTDKHHMTV